MEISKDTVIIKTTGYQEPFLKDISLDSLQEAVGGNIEALPVVPSAGDRLLLVDEEGKLKNDFEPNQRASALCRHFVVGDVVLLSEADTKLFRGDET